MPPAYEDITHLQAAAEFIGGPCDGLRIPRDEHTDSFSPRICVPHPTGESLSLDCKWRAEDEPLPPMMEYRRHYYELQRRAIPSSDASRPTLVIFAYKYTGVAK